MQCMNNMGQNPWKLGFVDPVEDFYSCCQSVFPWITDLGLIIFLPQAMGTLNMERIIYKYLHQPLIFPLLKDDYAETRFFSPKYGIRVLLI